VKGPFLLDTRTLIWALAAPDRLSGRARYAINSGELVMSVASFWEVTVKVQRGLLSVGDTAVWWERAVGQLGARVLSIRANHVAVLGKLPEHHKDPFDRLLISQAVADGLVLLSSDEMIRGYAVRWHW
jgi:PIN domain nuclease of toxin-antitoxin system